MSEDFFVLGSTDEATLSPQAWIVSALLGGSIQELISNGVMPTRLSQPYRGVWLWITEYTANYGTMPSFERLKEEFADVAIPKWDARPVDDVLDRFFKDLRLRITRAAVIEVGRAIENQGDYGEIWDKWAEMLAEINARVQVTSWKETIDKRFDTYQDALIRRLGGEEPGTGIMTGIRLLDDVTHGLQPGELVHIVGRYDTGKTTLMASTILAAAEANNLALVMSPEHASLSMMRKLDCLYMEADPVQLRMGNFNKSKLQEFDEYRAQMKRTGGDIVVIAGGDFSVELLGSLIATLHPKVAYIDGLSFLKKESRQGEQDWLALGAISKRLKNLANRFGIPIVSVLQMSRAGDIARSDMLGQGADLILEITKKSDDVVELKVTKYRETGSRGNAQYLRKGKTGLSFTETEDPEGASMSGWADM